MDKLSAMQLFTKVVSEESFSAAGRQMGLTRSAVSKSITELEQQLGVRLLNRTTRRVNTTEAGRAYFERCIEILAQVDDTERQISSLHDQPKGILKINAPLSFGTLYLGDAIADFMTLYPELKIELDLTDRFIDPIEEGVDVAIRIANLQDSSLVARKLGETSALLVASPDYLARHGEPQKPSDLISHKCIHYGRSTHLQKWQFLRDDKEISVRINAIMCSNNGDILRSAALKGHGLSQIPTFIIGEDLKEGRLTEVLPDHRPAPMGIYAIYAPNRYLAAKTRIFIDFLVEHCATENRLKWKSQTT